jgi:hypothetical protein
MQFFHTFSQKESKEEIKYSQTRLQRLAQDRPFLFVISEVRYNRVNICTKMINSTSKTVHYNLVFVNNHVRYKQVSLHVYIAFQAQDSVVSISIDLRVNPLIEISSL